MAGHVYKVSVTRTGYDFTVIYYDLTDNKEYCTLKATNTNMRVDVNIHVMAQVGTFTVSQTEPDAVAPSATPEASALPELGVITDSNGTQEQVDNNNTPVDNNTSGGTTGGDISQTPDDTDEPKDDDKDTKKIMKVSDIKAKKNTKKVTGTVSVNGAKVKVGKKAYKNAKVSGKKFTFTASLKLKKGTKITIKITKSGYKTITKTVKVK